VCFAISAVLFALLASFAPGQVATPSVLPPSAFEAFARRPEATFTWSKEVGRLDSRDSHAVVTALVVEDSTSQLKRMRGLRIDFSWAGQRSAIYVGESLLQPEKKIFDQLTVDVGRVNLYRGTLAYLGSCAFRDNPGVYPLVADFNYSGPESPALRIFSTAGEQIMFPGLTPHHLSQVLGNAIDELKAH
jgi:hypothetical protein